MISPRSSRFHGVGNLFPALEPSLILGCLIKQFRILVDVIHLIRGQLMQLTVEGGEGSAVGLQRLHQLAGHFQALDGNAKGSCFLSLLEPQKEQWECYRVRAGHTPCLGMYACMHVCMYVCMYGCMHGCMYVCTYVWMYAWVYVCMYPCIHVCMNLWIDGCTYSVGSIPKIDINIFSRIHACKTVLNVATMLWMHGCVDVWIDVWIYAWMDGCMQKCM